jgi:DNA-binding PadR family transcriptional regulator
MRTSSTSGFDLRDAVDGLRETFGPRPTAHPHPHHEHAGRDIRAAILRELREEPMHGYQIIQAIDTRTHGAWKPTPGSVYPTLQLLADEELVTTTQVGERKVYSLTDAGRDAAALVTDTDQHHEPERGQGTQSAVNLTKSSAKLAQAVTQVAHSGTPEQSKRAVTIIDEARRKLYAILAED